MNDMRLGKTARLLTLLLFCLACLCLAGGAYWSGGGIRTGRDRGNESGEAFRNVAARWDRSREKMALRGKYSEPK